VTFSVRTMRWRCAASRDGICATSRDGHLMLSASLGKRSLTTANV